MQKDSFTKNKKDVNDPFTVRQSQWDRIIVPASESKEFPFNGQFWNKLFAREFFAGVSCHHLAHLPTSVKIR